MLVDPTWVEASGYGSKAGFIYMKVRTGTHQYLPLTEIQRAKQGSEVLGRHRRQAASIKLRAHEINEGRARRRNAVCDL